MIDAGDGYVHHLKEARNASAVQKVKLATLRSVSPSTLVFAFEGIDDKAAYYQWIRRVSPDLKYEPFVCKTKAQVLQLMDSLSRDLTGLGAGVYFFVDQDFDGLQGRAAGDTVFVTRSYSIDNYLVSEEVLANLLTIEFHCHAEPQCRALVIDEFKRLYREFLDATRELNFRIYVARQCRIDQLADLPRRVGLYANVRLDSVEWSGRPLAELVVLEREPGAEEAAQHRAAFDQLDRPLRYRGKFALQFFRAWLELLRQDRMSAASKFFGGIPNDGFSVNGGFTCDTLAGKSELPHGLREFIGHCAAPA